MSQDRLGFAEPNTLNPAQKEASEWLEEVMKSYFGAEQNEIFRVRTETGGWLGPLPMLVDYPTLAKPYFHLLESVAKLATLSPEVRETAILSTGAVYACGYELYSHKLIAKNKTKLTQEQIEALSTQPEAAEGLSDECDITRKLTVALAAKAGPLSRDVWDKATEVLGKDETITVINFVGMYAYTCIVLNALNASVPKK